MRKLAGMVLVLVLGGGSAWAQQGAAAAGTGADSPQAAAGASAAATAPAAAPIEATPAIWRVKGAHGTVYLFGSVHVMQPNVEWETAKVKAALAASGTMYLEVADLDDQAALQPLVMQFGLDTAHPLSSKIGKDDVALLDAAAKSMGLPGEQAFETMRPWMASMMLSVLPMLKAGYAPTSGIDTTLLAESKSAGRPVKGFETMSEQIHLVADVPESEQVKELDRDLRELDEQTAETNKTVAAWERGDVETIGKIENDELAAKYPAEYRRMIVDRNQRWAAQLDGLLKDPGTETLFVAVGAAHLAGPDSLIRMLEKDGWTVERE